MGILKGRRGHRDAIAQEHVVAFRVHMEHDLVVVGRHGAEDPGRAPEAEADRVRNAPADG